jgi:hypothetical protein
MGAKQELSGEGEGLKVFGRLAQRRRTRPASYWLKAGLLAFLGGLNLVAALALIGAGVYLLTADKGEGDVKKASAELQLGGLAIGIRSAGREGTDAAAQQHAKETLALVCFALSLAPLSLAVLARMQYQLCKEMALLPPAPVGGEQQKE